jgi:hypothetical protein
VRCARLGLEALLEREERHRNAAKLFLLWRDAKSSLAVRFSSGLLVSLTNKY